LLRWRPWWCLCWRAEQLLPSILAESWSGLLLLRLLLLRCSKLPKSCGLLLGTKLPKTRLLLLLLPSELRESRLWLLLLRCSILRESLLLLLLLLCAKLSKSGLLLRLLLALRLPSELRESRLLLLLLLWGGGREPEEIGGASSGRGLSERVERGGRGRLLRGSEYVELRLRGRCGRARLLLLLLLLRLLRRAASARWRRGRGWRFILAVIAVVRGRRWSARSGRPPRWRLVLILAAAAAAPVAVVCAPGERPPVFVAAIRTDVLAHLLRLVTLHLVEVVIVQQIQDIL
jgi:hypothetical protein